VKRMSKKDKSAMVKAAKEMATLTGQSAVEIQAQMIRLWLADKIK
jgi:ribosomal protein L5